MLVLFDNGTCESFRQKLKYEEVYRQDCRNLAEVLPSIGCFIKRVYNERHLHSALGRRPPAEFEGALSTAEGQVLGQSRRAKTRPSTPPSYLSSAPPCSRHFQGRHRPGQWPGKKCQARKTVN